MGELALVTGASGGIGSATVRALLDRGFRTLAAVRRKGSVPELVSKGAIEVLLDVADESSMVSALDRIHSAYGAVDVLVNNAGLAIAAPIEELPMELLRHQLEVNVMGVVRMSQLVLPAMREQRKGRIITIGSVGGLFAAPGAGAYHMSKYAVEAYADALRVEVARFGVKVILLEPTGVRTPFAERQLETMPDTGAGSPYALFKQNMDVGVRQLFAPGSRAAIAPEAVAQAVVRAATIRSPRSRYRVGGLAHILPPTRRILGDRIWDSMMARQFRAE